MYPKKIERESVEEPNGDLCLQELHYLHSLFMYACMCSRTLQYHPKLHSVIEVCYSNNYNVIEEWRAIHFRVTLL